ncbi:MAG: membrane protein insertase YidC [Pseudomonadota bacterium]
MGGDDQTKNLILAAVLSMLVVFGWYTIFPPAPPPEEQPSVVTEDGQVPLPAVGEDDSPVQTGVLSREDAIAETNRIEIRSDVLIGSLQLAGGRIDDLSLTKYNVRLNDEGEKVHLLYPQATVEPYFVEYGWRRTADSPETPLPGAETVWTLEDGSALTPQTPVTLKWDNGAGLIFRRTVTLDENYMFNIRQTVENTTDQEFELYSFGRIARTEGLSSTALWILHEGPISVVDGELQEIDYDDLLEIAPDPNTRVRRQHLAVNDNGWIGFTDKYWMASLVGKAGTGFDGYYQVVDRGPRPIFQALMLSRVITVAPAGSGEIETNLFAGAKEYYTLTDYEENLGIVDFHKAIDWGWFYFLTKPIFQLLAWVQGYVGNMGFAIIALTLIIKTILFPLAWKSYVSMSKMKKLQPEMEKIKERVGDDRQKLQQEMMALYKKEKVNPASGCLPILLQIPIFFSLYKVLFVTIEMRHAPFVGWIQDLSAPDPTSFMNLFGALPWDTPGPESIFVIFSIGVYPILMGITMWLQQKLNPAPTDPTQAMIFAWMPWVFMFMLGTFAAGLVIYWVANNTITFIQQYLIMRSQGVKPDIFGNIMASFKRKTGEQKS